MRVGWIAWIFIMASGRRRRRSQVIMRSPRARNDAVVVDRIVKREAALGAKSAHVPFVAYSAANERAMNALLAKTGVLPSPAIIVVKRNADWKALTLKT